MWQEGVRQITEACTSKQTYVRRKKISPRIVLFRLGQQLLLHGMGVLLLPFGAGPCLRS